MTKLDGTSGQLFAGLAEILNTRTASRFDKGAGGKPVDNSFRDLLHTVSNPAARAPSDQTDEASIKAGMLRTRLAQSDEPDEKKDNTVHERAESTDEVKPSGKRGPLDSTPTAEVQSRSSLPSTASAGLELAAMQAIKPQAQPFAVDKNDAPARSGQSASGRELVAASAAQAMTAGLAGPATRPAAAAPTQQGAPLSKSASTAPRGATTQQGSTPLPGSTAAMPGFEAATANVGQAAKESSREALPQPIKVTVVQQETHLPPVAQFTAGQQVANAVVTELKGSPASSAAATSSAAANAVPSQGNAPDQPLNILTISLDPPALGNVTVRLRLMGEAVSVHLAADRKDTSQMLDQQRDSIRELMQSAGYVADVAPVRHGALDGFQPGGAGQSHGSLSGQQQAPNGQGASDNSSASSGQPGGGAKQARDDRQPNQEARHEQNVAPHTRRGPVYL